MRIQSAAELAGVEMFGETERVVRGRRVFEPAAGGLVMRSLLRMGVVETQAVVAKVFADIGVNNATVRLFLKRREIARLPAELGGGLEARPIIPGLDDDTLSNYAGSENAYEMEVMQGLSAVIDDSKKRYKLNSLFRDATLSDKLRISARRMQTAKRLALSNPAAAAASLTDYIRDHGFPNAQITAGDYAKSVNNAVDFIHAMGKTIVYADSCAPAKVSQTHLEISYDQFHLKDVIWTVRGPLKFATEVNVIYQLSILHGPDRVIMMLASETLRLGIDIRNEKTGDYYKGALHGFSSMSGILPGGFGFPSELTADQQARLLVAGRKVSPVYVGDAIVGSAVHVSDKHAILNEHTIAMAARNDVVLELRGQSLNETTSVSGDICVVRSGGDHAEWLFREPEVGERVVLCYSVGDTVEYSEVLRVQGCADQLILSGSNILRKGASGAAVVALRDSALLGIFSTMRASTVFCALFTSSDFAVVSDYQSVASISQYAGTPGLDAGNHTYARMVKRGLLGFLEHTDKSVAPVYVKEDEGLRMSGVVTNVAGDWFTTVNPNSAQLYMRDSRPLTFRHAVDGVYSVNNPPPVLQAVPNVRAPEPGERVFAFTKVDDDVIMSSVRIVTHCLADNRAFSVEDFGHSDEVMTGALIVAERDAAVLGMYADRICDNFGRFSVRCQVFPKAGDDRGNSLNSQIVVTEIDSWILPVDSVRDDYIKYGRLLWEVLVGRRARHGGSSLMVETRVAATLWSENVRSVARALGWAIDDSVHVSKYGVDELGLVFLAAMYLRDAVATVEKVENAIKLDRMDATPVSVGFPFPRPSSAAESIVSARATMVTPDNARLHKLEQELLRLTEMVVSQDKRSSGGWSDNG